MEKKTISYVMNILRYGTTTWPTRNEVLNRGRRKKKVGVFLNGKDKEIFEHACEKCGKWEDMKDSTQEVDHIKEVGPFDGDWNSMVNKIYCDISNLQRLCVECHSIKTSGYNSTLIYERKKKSETKSDVKKSKASLL